jgi:haloalkane dehalogenase
MHSSARTRPFSRLVLLGAVALTVFAAPTLSAQTGMRERTNMRGERYGEILVVTGGPLHFTGHVYNTIGLNDCPEAQWKALDPEKLKKQFKARSVLLNGPRAFVMDSNALAKPGAVATFDGLEARHLADVAISLGTILKGRAKAYTENRVARTSRYVFKKGRPVYELLSPDGRTYVMQSYSMIVDPSLKMSDLAGLGSRLQLPAGWKYRTRVPSEDLVMNATGTAYVLQDNLENSYQRME